MTAASGEYIVSLVRSRVKKDTKPARVVEGKSSGKTFRKRWFNWQGSLNVPIEHHPTIRYMVYNGYYKVMSNIPKMGQLPTPDWSQRVGDRVSCGLQPTKTCSFIVFFLSKGKAREPCWTIWTIGKESLNRQPASLNNICHSSMACRCLTKPAGKTLGVVASANVAREQQLHQ